MNAYQECEAKPLRPQVESLSDFTLENLSRLSELHGEYHLMTQAGSRISVLAVSENVLIMPYDPVDMMPTDIFVQAWRNKDSAVELAVSTRYRNGDYFDPEFRAAPLARFAVGFIELNSPASALRARYVEDSRSQYLRALQMAPLTSLEFPSQRDVDHDSVRQTWAYKNVAEPLGFRTIRGIETSPQSDDLDSSIEIFFSR